MFIYYSYNFSIQNVYICDLQNIAKMNIRLENMQAFVANQTKNHIVWTNTKLKNWIEDVLKDVYNMHFYEMIIIVSLDV